MTFNRQLYKQKPQAWGPVSSVQASIFKNAESIGIDPAVFEAFFTAWPDDPNTFKNILSEKHFTKTYGQPKYKNNALYLTDNGGGVDNDIMTANSLRFGTAGVNSTWIFNITPELTASTYQRFVFGVSTSSLFKIDNSSGQMTFDVSMSSRGYRSSFSGLNFNNLNQVGISINWPVAESPCVGGYGILNGLNTSLDYLGYILTPNYVDTEWGSVRFCHGSHVNYYGYTGYIHSGFKANCLFTDSQIAYLYDNPYFLLQRVAPVFYSVPGGGGAITITTALDGKVIIRTTTSALLDCMASIKNNASNILDCAAVVSTTKSDAVDGKAILKSVASKVFDSKASVLSIASLLLDGKAIVSDTGSALLDGKGIVKDSTYNIVDGKSIVKSNNTAILDGKSIFLSAGGPVIDGKIIVNADGFSSVLLDGKTSIKSVATNYLDGLIYIGNAADKNIDGKAIIKSEVCLSIDGKTTIQDVASNLFDGSASIMTSIANIVDGNIIISDAVIGLLDGNASIMDDSSIVLDGKVFLSSGSEINVFDGRITLSVPIVGKVTVSFSMRSPSVSFSMKTPAATLSIN